MKQNVAGFLKSQRLPINDLFVLDTPFSLLRFPSALNNTRVEGHVPSKAEYLAYLVQVLPDVLGLAEKPRPFRVESPLEGVRMARDIAGTIGISVLQPRPSDVLILLDDFEVDILTM